MRMTPFSDQEGASALEICQQLRFDIFFSSRSMVNLTIKVREFPFTEIVAMEMPRASRINYYSSNGLTLLFAKQKFGRGKKKSPPSSYSP